MKLSFEKEIKNYLNTNGINYKDQSDSFEYLDFELEQFHDSEKSFHLDVKEKRQRYNMQNWKTKIPQEYFFIIDDLAARKILAYAPRSGIIIRDNILNRYCLFTVLDLYLMPKKRTNRPIKKQTDAYKGKWLVDLRNGIIAEDLATIFGNIHVYLKYLKKTYLETLECYGKYQGEIIDQQGIIRKPEHWNIDVAETR
ncbi:MAG: hypothetical protein GY795_11920 [Desulfobacterales bacterium]|nr:hypothetical protein [Desulfobacterales bacterium]